MQYIYVSQNGIKLIPCDGVIPFLDLRNKVGIPDTESCVELIYNQFSDRRTVIVCDEEGRIKNLPRMGITRSGLGIRGAFIVAGLILVKGERELGGMSQPRVEIALREIQLVRQ